MTSNVIAGRYADPTFNEIERSALQWLDGFYSLEHLLCTRVWAIRLCADASPELKFAALVHDAERFFPGGPTSTPSKFDDPDYLFAHSIRSADIVEAWLRARTPPPAEDYIGHVRRLILRHEIGGGWEADILQAADSLSFLETFDWLTVDWVRSGRYTIPQAKEKLDFTVERIRPSAALRHALPLYERAVRLLESAHDSRMDLKQRRAIAGNRRLLLGELPSPEETAPSR